uniref:CHK kinase-like domain-containing protein n=1 Tax=Timema cristinae TaxID=61476 RepID=A0A7R9H5S9_TIMCR|nr:unnamed protein product [Timema cristinae]
MIKKVNPHLCGERERVKNHLGNTSASSSNQDLNLNLPILVSLAQHEASAFAKSATEAVPITVVINPTTTQHDNTRHHMTIYDTTRQFTTQHDNIRHNTTIYDTTRQYMTQHDNIRHNTTIYDTTRHNTTIHDTTRNIRHNTTIYDTTIHDMTRHDTTCHEGVIAMASDKPELITKSDLEEVMKPHLDSNTSVESFETTPLTKPGDNYGIIAMASDKPELITKYDLDEVMRPHLDSNTSVECFETTPLTKPGDNYGSNILSLDVILNPSHEKLALVAKLVPLAEILREMFQCDITVRKENDMYVLVRPEYEKIQKEKKVPADKFLDVFPECYGARATRGEDVGQPVGDGALLLLENLKAKGYVTGDRQKGLDMRHSKLAIANLARFHATAIAIRNHKPQVFKDTVLKACRPSTVGLPDEDEHKKEILEYIKSIPDCKQHADKVEAVFEKTYFLSASSVIGSEAFKSIAHRDFWTSNMMFRYAEDDVKRESPIGFKIVDFQVVVYCSPIQDLIFFLYTSTEMGLVVDHYDELIRVYYDSLIEFLQLLDCDIGPFSFETFLEEIELVAPKEFIQVVKMLQPICIDKEILPSEFSEFENVDFTSDQFKKGLGHVFLRRLSQTVNEFYKRGLMGKVVAMASDKPELITKSDLEEVMRPHLDSNTSVESFETTPLTKPGDNYGSNILSLDVILSPSHEKLALVAKLVPLAEILREMFQCDITVRKENDMYVLVRPEYEKIQKEKKVPADKFLNAFPACYGARATRGEDVGQPVGDGALLLLENLKAKGYVTGDRQKGLDMRHSKLAIANLARFHATAIAIRNHKPQVFKDTILRACRPSNVTPPDENEPKKQILEYIKSIPDCKQHAALSSGVKSFKSIAHRDFWTSNMMFRYAEDDVKRESPIGFKIVDFQVAAYCSPIQDLIFFIYTSTEMGLVVDHYDELIRVYYDSLIEFLQLLDCDIGPFSFETFLEEIELVAPKEFTHVVEMLQPICIDKESLPSEFSEFENFNFACDKFKKVPYQS